MSGGTVIPEASLADAQLTTTDFAECYRYHYARVMRALRLAGAEGEEAEDLAQEAFARALVHWRRVRRGTNPPGYVYRTAFRLYARKLRRHETDPLDDDRRSPADDPQAESVTRLSVEAALARMPPRRRLCATLCFVVGMTTAEAAEALGIADGTVRKQLEAARVALRQAL